MTTGYTLHFAPDNASVIVRMALEALGQPYEAALVDRSKRAQDSPAYRALNPLGMIPALETPDGVIFETGAILLWLADRHGALFPKVGDAARGDALKWLFFLSNSLHAGLRQMFYPEKYIAAAHADELRAGLMPKLQADFVRLEQLAADPTVKVLGSAYPTMLDFYACALLRWAQIYPEDHAGWLTTKALPHLMRAARALEGHPAVLAASRAEGLGPAPFSNPDYANPPVGSAT